MLPHPDGDEAPAIRDLRHRGRAGALTVTATVTNDDAFPSCTVTGSVSFEVKPATAPIVSNLRQPPPFKGKPGLVWDSKFWFWVKPGPTGVVTPLTVEARAIRRARLPGARVPAKRITFPMRPTDGPVPEQEPFGGCGAYTLICTPRVRTWPKGAEVDVLTKGGREVPALVKVLVTLPRGVPTLHYRSRRPRSAST